MTCSWCLKQKKYRAFSQGQRGLRYLGRSYRADPPKIAPSGSPQCADDCIGELLGACVAADVAREVFALAIDSVERLLDALRRDSFPQVVEHHNCAHQDSGRIGDAFTRNVRSSPMDD